MVLPFVQKLLPLERRTAASEARWRMLGFGGQRVAAWIKGELSPVRLGRRPAPYSGDQLSAVAANCTQKEDAARKVERTMHRRIVAVALEHRTGERFSAVVTGVGPKGVFVRVLHPPVEGRLIRGEHGLDVGDRLTVTLVGSNPERGFIDFAA